MRLQTRHLLFPLFLSILITNDIHALSLYSKGDAAMQITYLSVRNFKSIRNLEIRHIENALILVGKNNTGKTGGVTSMLTLWRLPGVRTGEPCLLSCAKRIIAPEKPGVKEKICFFRRNSSGGWSKGFT